MIAIITKNSRDDILCKTLINKKEKNRKQWLLLKLS